MSPFIFRWLRVLYGLMVVWSASGLLADSAVPLETLRFQVHQTRSGAPVYKFEYRYSRLEEGGQRLLRQTAHFTWPNGNVGDETCDMRQVGDRILPRSYRLIVQNSSGKVIRTEGMTFDARGRHVHITRSYDDPTRLDDYGITDRVDLQLAIPADTFPRPMFDGLIRSLNLAPGARIPFHVLTRLGEIYPIILVEDGVETLKTAAGMMETQRIRMVPDIPILPRVMPSPTIRVWYTRQLPRLPLQFDGYLNPPPPRFQKEVHISLTELTRPK